MYRDGNKVLFILPDNIVMDNIHILEYNQAII